MLGQQFKWADLVLHVSGPRWPAKGSKGDKRWDLQAVGQVNKLVEAAEPFGQQRALGHGLTTGHDLPVSATPTTPHHTPA